MCKFHSFIALVLFVLSWESSFSSETVYVKEKLDTRISIEVPSGWDKDPGLKIAESYRAIPNEVSRMFVSPQFDAKLIFHIKYGPTYKNIQIVSLGLSPNFLKEYSYKVKQAVEKGFQLVEVDLKKKMNIKILDWATATISSINGYYAIHQTYLRTTYNKEYNTRIMSYRFDLTDRTVDFQIEFSENKMQDYLKILTHVLSTFSYNPDNR